MHSAASLRRHGGPHLRQPPVQRTVHGLIVDLAHFNGSSLRDTRNEDGNSGGSDDEIGSAAGEYVLVHGGSLARDVIRAADAARLDGPVAFAPGHDISVTIPATAGRRRK